jgi:hypothetical protein
MTFTMAHSLTLVSFRIPEFPKNLFFLRPAQQGAIWRGCLHHDDERSRHNAQVQTASESNKSAGRSPAQSLAPLSGATPVIWPIMNSEVKRLEMMLNPRGKVRTTEGARREREESALGFVDGRDEPEPAQDEERFKRSVAERLLPSTNG